VRLFDNGGVADAAAEHEVLYAEEKRESAKTAFIKDHLETNTNFLARLYEVQKSLCHHRRRRRPMLTFVFRSNVDKLLGPG